MLKGIVPIGERYRVEEDYLRDIRDRNSACPACD